jgi:hypothetical protein
MSWILLLHGSGKRVTDVINECVIGIPQEERDGDSSGTHHPTSLVVLEAMMYLPAVLTSESEDNPTFVTTHVSSSINERRPFNFRQESFQKFGVEFGLPDLQLNIFERQREVVCIAVLCMAR